MVTLEIVGVRHAKWQKLLQRTQKAIREAGVEANIVRVTEPEEIVERGIMVMPALILEGQLKCAGNIPTVAEIKEWVCKKPRHGKR